MNHLVIKTAVQSMSVLHNRTLCTIVVSKNTHTHTDIQDHACVHTESESGVLPSTFSHSRNLIWYIGA